MGLAAECCNNESQLDAPLARRSYMIDSGEELIVYGDYFDQDTRSIIAICDIAGLKPKVELVDTFKTEHMSDAFTQLNPRQSIPVLVIKSTERRVVTGDGGLSSLYNTLVSTQPEVDEKLYPADQYAGISSLMLWHKKTLRKRTARIINSALQSSHNARDSCRVVGSLKTDIDALFKEDLQECETRLAGGQKHLTGEHLSILDVMIYCEISTITSLLKEKIPPETAPKLAEWSDKMAKLSAL